MLTVVIWTGIWMIGTNNAGIWTDIVMRLNISWMLMCIIAINYDNFSPTNQALLASTCRIMFNVKWRWVGILIKVIVNWLRLIIT